MNNACMHGYAKEHRKHDEVKVHNVGVEGKHAIW